MIGNRTFHDSLLCLGVLCVAAAAAPGARWEFDGSLTDASGNGHTGRAAKVRFVPTPDGRGLGPGIAVTVPNAADLQVYPLLYLDCRFRLEAAGTAPQILVQKDEEYLLRVDWEREGGQISFFVFVDGQWEPRVRGPVARAGVWYDVQAGWDGGELVLEVNGRRWSRPRKGRLRRTSNPVIIGPVQGVVDRVAIRAPGYEREQAMLRLGRETGAETKSPRFGAEDGWPGWRGVNGAAIRVRDGAIQARLDAPTSLLAGPRLALPAAELPFVCVEADAPDDAVLALVFTGDGGTGAVPFRPLKKGRTVLVNLAEHPAWRGTIRRLALGPVSPCPVQVTLRRLIASNRLEGKPFLYVRNFAPRHAKLRPNRSEKLIAVVKNLGGDAKNVRVTLSAPAGVRIVDGAERKLTVLPESSFDLVTWTVRADRPLTGRAVVRATAGENVRTERELTLAFAPPPKLPRTGYVPVPQPAQTEYTGLMHYCALWKEGTHYGWGRIEPWPERRPAIGYYDEGTPEVADWHIKYALEHGIGAFIYCWYRSDFSPEIHQQLGHAIHEGLFRARYRDRFRFSIMWENGCGKGVKDAADLLDNLFPFWLKNYFTHPSYLKIGNMPVLFVWRPEKVAPQLGGSAAVRRTFEAMRRKARSAGLAGLRIVGCLDRANPPLQKRLAVEGWDATSGYAVRPAAERIVGVDIEGIPMTDHGDTLRKFKDEWLARRNAGPLPDIPNVMMGWDPRPWHGAATRSYRANPAPEHFEAACRDAKALVDQAPADAWYRRLVVFDNWTEFGEGHYIEPTSGTGFAYVNAIKRVFCTRWAPEEVTDIIPEDVGLAPPQKRYDAVRKLYGGLPWRPRVIRNHLIARWRFDGGNDALFLDSSGSAFHLVRRDAPLVPGRRGKAMECGVGWGSYPAHPAFFPRSGITVSLWCRPATARQSDRWMLNTVGSGANGYRLGLTEGRPCWQVPRERWSHLIRGPDPLPTDRWTHLAATFDNRTMRLYVNGRLVGEKARPGLLRPSQSDLYVGTYGGTRARFRGRLDDVCIMDRALSPREIAALAAE
ncbi:MAG: hypothetical protein GXP31_11385 [Kiritimatiellaeota bacterium]|nr:hypothetical protein [Kiritimatiellota bacterium]